MANAGRVLTRDVLIDRIWGPNYFGDTKTLDVHIKRLRSKIEPDPASPGRIVTVRGVGYRYERAAAAAIAYTSLGQGGATYVAFDDVTGRVDVEDPRAALRAHRVGAEVDTLRGVVLEQHRDHVAVAAHHRVMVRVLAHERQRVFEARAFGERRRPVRPRASRSPPSGTSVSMHRTYGLESSRSIGTPAKLLEQPFGLELPPARRAAAGSRRPPRNCGRPPWRGERDRSSTLRSCVSPGTAPSDGRHRK